MSRDSSEDGEGSYGVGVRGLSGLKTGETDCYCGREALKLIREAASAAESRIIQTQSNLQQPGQSKYCSFQGVQRLTSPEAMPSLRQIGRSTN